MMVKGKLKGMVTVIPLQGRIEVQRLKETLRGALRAMIYHSFWQRLC